MARQLSGIEHKILKELMVSVWWRIGEDKRFKNFRCNLFVVLIVRANWIGLTDSGLSNVTR